MLSCCSFGLRRIAALSSRSKTNTHTSGFSISARIPSAHDPALEILNGKLCQSTPYVDMLSHRLHGTHSCKAMSVPLSVLVVVVVWAWLFQGCISTRNPQCLVIAYQDLTDAAALCSGCVALSSQQSPSSPFSESALLRHLAAVSGI